MDDGVRGSNERQSRDQDLIASAYAAGVQSNLERDRSAGDCNGVSGSTTFRQRALEPLHIGTAIRDPTRVDAVVGIALLVAVESRLAKRGLGFSRLHNAVDPTSTALRMDTPPLFHLSPHTPPHPPTQLPT